MKHHKKKLLFFIVLLNISCVLTSSMNEEISKKIIPFNHKNRTPESRLLSTSNGKLINDESYGSFNNSFQHDLDFEYLLKLFALKILPVDNLQVLSYEDRLKITENPTLRLMIDQALNEGCKQKFQ